ncbi:MAG: hypothetical protein WBV61_09140, partial [Rhodanobacteraceae bacterium]
MQAPAPIEWRNGLSDWRVLLVLAVVVLLPIGRVSELPVVIGGVVAIVLLCANTRVWLAAPGIQLAAVLFACYWIPALVSGFT